MGIKVAVIGGASSYTPELFAEWLAHPEWPKIDQVVLMDTNPEKLSFIGEVCEKLLPESGEMPHIHTSLNHEEAVSGADFIIMQVRVGGLSARVRDETLPMELGMVGNETTGAGGFACALRTVPVALAIARDIERISPDAWLLNLSNPAGIVTEALIKHTSVRTIGFCNIPINTTYGLAEILSVDPGKIQLDSFGLNHLSWVRSAFVDGEDKLQTLIAQTHNRHAALYQRGLVDSLIDPDWLRALGMIPGWYLRYFYCTDQVLKRDRQSPQTRGSQDMEAEKKIRELYETQGYGEAARRILQAKGGAQYYLPVLQVIDSIVNDKGKVIVADVKNGNALPDLPPEVCVEIPARIFGDRYEALHIGPMPLTVRGLVQQVKAYEELTVEAAVTGDRQVASAALMAHPLVGSYPIAKEYLNRMLENERTHLPHFFKSSR